VIPDKVQNHSLKTAGKRNQEIGFRKASKEKSILESLKAKIRRLKKSRGVNCGIFWF